MPIAETSIALENPCHPTDIPTMPTTLTSTSKYANMTASQVLAEQQRQLALWQAEDTARRARNAAILASL